MKVRVGVKVLLPVFACAENVRAFNLISAARATEGWCKLRNRMDLVNRALALDELKITDLGKFLQTLAD